MWSYKSHNLLYDKCIHVGNIIRSCEIQLDIAVPRTYLWIAKGVWTITFEAIWNIIIELVRVYELKIQPSWDLNNELI